MSYLRFSLFTIVMSSITLSVTGNSSSLTSYFHPEITLDERFNYSCCLLDFFTYNSIPNVHEGNNKFYYYSSDDNSTLKVITIPVGSYEIDEIINFICTRMENDRSNDIDKFFLKANRNTMKCKIDSDVIVDFSKKDCIGSVLGFEQRILSKGPHKSDKIINIQDVNTIRVDCDLTSGSFHNGKGSHTIYEFTPSVVPGYKMNEQPKHLIYLPVTRRRISTVNISIVDQNGRLLDFRGEKITCRIHLKRDT